MSIYETVDRLEAVNEGASDAFVYDPLDLGTLANPYPTYAALRALPTLYWHDGMKAYVASTYQSCKYALVTNALFAKDRRRIGQEIPDSRRSVQTEDPPHRLGLRQDFRHALHQTDLVGLCQSVGERFAERLADVGDSFNFAKDVAYPTALDLTASVIGLSSDQALDYLTCHRALLRATDAGLDESRLEEGRAAGERLQRYAAEWLEQESIEALLVPARAFAKQYPIDYSVRTLAGMVNASFSTAASFTTGIFDLMARDEGVVIQAQKAIEQGHGYRAVSEFLRFLAPAQATNRVVVADCELQGVQLHRGDTVVTLMASANRDPQEYEWPDTINLFRVRNRHLSFAAGPHLCLGKKLAELWGIELIKRLVSMADALAGMTLEKPQYLDSATVRSIVSLPVHRSF